MKTIRINNDWLSFLQDGIEINGFGVVNDVASSYYEEPLVEYADLIKAWTDGSLSDFMLNEAIQEICE